MKLDSKYFDCIRIRPAAERPIETGVPRCQWKGCTSAGLHRAPRDRGRDGRFYYFCIEHVRQFNASYNYFEGMSDAEVEGFQKDATTGHRPTWRLGDNLAGVGRGRPAGARRYARFARDGADDLHGVFGDFKGSTAAGNEAPRRPLKTLEQRALEKLDLTETASKDEIKTRFKALVKRHHPDANGGDRGSEEKLREVIQAYNYLKQAGIV
jgi:hypothetical protein